MKGGTHDIIVDIETDGLNPSCIHVVSTLNLETRERLRWFQEQAGDFERYIRSARYIIGHNFLSFDAPALGRIWGVRIPVRKILDTLVLSYLALPQREAHSLEYWGDLLGYPKVEHEDWSTYTEAMGRRCDTDCEITAKVYERLMSDLSDFSEQSIELEHKVRHIVNQQEKHGFLLNVPRAMGLRANLMQQAAEIESSFDQLFPPLYKPVREVVPKVNKDGSLSAAQTRCLGEHMHHAVGPFTLTKVVPFNPSSPMQVLERLEGHWNPTEKTKGGAWAVSEKNLETLKADAPDEMHEFCRYRMLTSRVNTLEQWLDASDDEGYVHGQVFTNGANTSRMRHRYPNMANVPSMKSPYGKECRQCFTVPSGYKLVGTDAEGLELRMLAHSMNSPEFTSQVLDGDPHIYNQNIAGLPTRADAKTFIYAFIYGAGNAKIGSIVGGSSKKGAALRKKFLTNLPELGTLVNRVRNQALRSYVRGIDGRKIWVASAHSALNYLLQGNGAIVCKKWLTLMYDYVKKEHLRAQLVGSIHDEYQWQVHEDDVEAFIKIPDECMRLTGEHFKMRLPLNASVQVGNNWSETH